ncbi:MAG: nucleotidyltransferase substrate binding protein [bacterium]
MLHILQNFKIQSFEFCIDLLWKFLKLYFYKISGKELENSPKPIFRHCLSAKLTNEKETKQLLKMVDDRNPSSHTYHEAIAEEINNRIENNYKLLQIISQRI